MTSQSAAAASRPRYLKSIAYLQIIGIVFVVIGHSFHEYPDGEMGHSMLLYRMMYSFRMPLFMFVSGFLMVFTTESNNRHPRWKEFASTKVKRLLVPFVVLSLVTFVPRALFSDMADDHVELSFRSLAESLILSKKQTIPYLWFLQSSFTLLTVIYAVLTFVRNHRLNRGLTYLLLIVAFTVMQFIPLSFGHIFSLADTFRLGIFFVLGASYAHTHNSIDRLLPWTSALFAGLVAAAWAISFFVTEHTDFMPLCSLLGIMMCISAAKLLEKHEIGILDHLIGANYIIFLLSWFCNVACQQVLHHFTDLPWWVYTTLSIFSGIYVPWWFYRYMLHHPESRLTYLATHLLGQSFRRKTTQLKA